MPPITDLAGVQAWLGGVTVGNTVDVGTSLFDPSVTEVYALFGLLAGSDPISLTVTAVDATGATLAGTATVLEEDGTTCAFTFTQPAADLLLALELTLPAATSWTLLTQFDVEFGTLVATFAPDPLTGFVSLTIASVLAAGTMQVPVQLTVPTFDGDWQLSGTFQSIGNLDAASLQALAGGQNLMSIVPGFDLSNFSLTGFELSFNPAAETLSLVRVAFAYALDWSFFSGAFLVTDLDFEFEVFTPFTGPILQAKVTAEMSIGGVAIDVGVQFTSTPTCAVFAMLAPGTTLPVADLFTFFQVQPPSGFPAIDITSLGFTFFVVGDAAKFYFGIANPFPIIGDVALDSFFFDLDATNAGGALTVTGDLSAAFTIGGAAVVISGQYAADGTLLLAGTASNIDLGQLISDLAAQFGATAPGPIANLVIETLTVALTAGTTDAFTMTMVGTTTVAGVTATFTPMVNVTYDSATSAWTGTFWATLVIGTVTFAVQFSDTPTDMSITATYTDTGQGLTFADIASAFGFSPPAFPPDLDLDLTAAGFTYDFTTGTLALGAQSTTYGNAAFASLVIGQARAYCFLLDSGQSFSLSNLPLIGAELAKIETIEVDALAVIATSKVPLLASDATAINAALRALGKGYPLVPATGVTGALTITAVIEVGETPLPLELSLLGGSGGSGSALVAAAASAPPAPTSSDGVSWYTLQQTFGPVSIARIGALYQSDTQTLWFEIDASIAFGPLSVSLSGLGIGSPLTTFAPQFTLAGLGVSYQSAPLVLSGALVNLSLPGSSALDFEGGVTIGTGGLTIEAFGYYGNQAGFPSLFIFGDLAYDLGGPPAFFITGVALGVGYNSSLRLPTISQVAAFPFVATLPGSTAPTSQFGPSSTPLSVLDAIMQTSPPWVTPVEGALWFAAGITFTTYGLLNSQALAVLQLGSDLTISLIGTSRAQFPQLIDSSVRYAYVELDLDVLFAPSQGVFSMQAQLAPSSFLIDPTCVLTGGFAFFVWFGASPHAGDFVLSLGGYNAGFSPPSYYPSVPLVGFHWTIDSSITISGGAYLALTPAALMAGGELDATYHSGNLKAWFDARADVVIRWKPFWVTATIGVTVGASYTVDLLVTTSTITVELGCELSLWGPPTGGTVKVSWSVISFTIAFGAPQSQAPTISGWPDVVAMLPNSGTATAPNVVSIAATTGLLPVTTAPAAATAPWTVRGSTFGFATTTAVPASAATVGAAHAFAGEPFAVFPLGWTGVTATHVVTIVDSTGTDWSAAFAVAPQLGAVPAALWGAPPTKNGQPVTPNGGDQLVASQLVGVAAQVLPPQIGATAGAVDVDAYLASYDLDLPGADLPLSSGAPPTGDIPVDTGTAVASIADPTTGIASANAIAARLAILTGLGALGYAPTTANDPMTRFTADLGGAFADEPLLVA